MIVIKLNDVSICARDTNYAHTLKSPTGPMLNVEHGKQKPSTESESPARKAKAVRNIVGNNREKRKHT
jgi:hypothetical protein